jgi:hypothetical protein
MKLKYVGYILVAIVVFKLLKKNKSEEYSNTSIL